MEQKLKEYSQEEIENIYNLLSNSDNNVAEIGMTMLEKVVFDKENAILWEYFVVIQQKEEKTPSMKKFIEKMQVLANELKEELEALEKAGKLEFIKLEDIKED